MNKTETIATKLRWDIYGYIYKTTNVVNNRFYVGQHKGKFNSIYLGSGIALKNAIRKYGRNKFKLQLIKYAINRKQLDKLEKAYIKYYREIHKDKIYNISKGGSGGAFWIPGECPEKVKENIRKGQQKRKDKYGYIISPEVREKHNKVMRGDGNPNKRLEVREKISKALKGKKHLPTQGFQKGHKFGFKNGNIPWNKGLTKKIDKRLRKQ